MEESGDWDSRSELFSFDREGEAWDGEEAMDQGWERAVGPYASAHVGERGGKKAED